jgi:hypothetical protein
VKLAERAAGDALTVADAVGDRRAQCWALGVLALIKGMGGHEIEAMPMCAQANRLARGDPDLVPLQMMLQINQANMLGDLDRHHEAIAAAKQVQMQAETTDHVLLLAQAHSTLGELFFDIGRWDDALTETAHVADGTDQPYVECINRSLAAIIKIHREDTSAGEDLIEAERHAARANRTVSFLILARSLNRERTNALEDAFTILTDGLSQLSAELEQTIDLLPDAVRLAVRVGDLDSARTLTQTAEAISRHSTTPHRKAVALYCRGLSEHDDDILITAADYYATAGRRLLQAQAIEAAAAGKLGADGTLDALPVLDRATSLYAKLGARWDLARIHATVPPRTCGDAA